MTNPRDLLVLALVMAALVSVNYFSALPWLARCLSYLILVGGAVFLPPAQSMVPGVLAIPVDWMMIERSPHSGDLLVWAGFVALVYGLSEYSVSPSPPAVSTPDEDPEPPGAHEAAEEEILPFPGAKERVSGDRDADPTQTLQELLVDHFRWARNALEFDNLLYYHVHDNRASVGYVINELGELNLDQTLGADVSQGVGWVLRHGQSLDRQDHQIDWRSLQYHARPVDLHRVWMSPVEPNGEMRGVLVLEWASAVELEDDELEGFRRKVQKMMELDRSVRALRETHRQFRLREELYELDVVELRFENLIQRSLEVVRSVLPADHVEFLRGGSPAGDDTVIEQRRLFYDRCYEWVEKQGRVLRVESMDSLPRQTRSLAQAAPPDVGSILAGPVGEDEPVGVLVLDHEEPDFFTDVDSSLFDELLTQLNRLFRRSRQLESLRGERDLYHRWVEVLGEETEPLDSEACAKSVTDRLVEDLSVRTAAVYWRSEDSFRRRALAGSGTPTESVPGDHPMIRRLVENASTGVVQFDDLSRFDRYEPPTGSASMRLVPVREDQRLVGFLALFHGAPDPVVRPDGEDFERLGPLLGHRLLEAHRREERERRAASDPASELVNYPAWKRSLTRFVSREGPAELTLWRLGVPGFESVCLERGYQRGQHWIRSITNQIREEFVPGRVTRNYGTTFLGYTTEDPGRVDERLERLQRTLVDWSFPSGEWPGSPRTGRETFSSPYPDVDNMVNAARTVERRRSNPGEDAPEVNPSGEFQDAQEGRNEP